MCVSSQTPNFNLFSVKACAINTLAGDNLSQPSIQFHTMITYELFYYTKKLVKLLRRRGGREKRMSNKKGKVEIIID